MLFLVVFSGLLLVQGAWSQVSPEGCLLAMCTTYQEINTLHCHLDPARFCRCSLDENGGWVLQVMSCPGPETLFSRSQQVCIHSSLWNEYECMILNDTRS
ncbi:hypothetical protein RP20_CCG017828 [Aedes albopictus]|nr:hypothetical protein RP20_CCG017828 [Aedes albopictus]